MDKKFENTQKNIVISIIFIETLLFAIAFLWGYFANINPFNSISFNYPDLLIAVVSLIILLSFNYVAINVLSKYIEFFKKLKEAYESVIPHLLNINLPNAFIIALVSGFTEEFFFRGIIQEQFGIIIASIIFGLFHIGSKKTVYYGIYTIFIGGFLGWLYIKTDNLFVPVCVHFLNNFLAVPYMKHYAVSLNK